MRLFLGPRGPILQKHPLLLFPRRPGPHGGSSIHVERGNVPIAQADAECLLPPRRRALLPQSTGGSVGSSRDSQEGPSRDDPRAVARARAADVCTGPARAYHTAPRAETVPESSSLAGTCPCHSGQGPCRPRCRGVRAGFAALPFRQHTLLLFVFLETKGRKPYSI